MEVNDSWSIRNDGDDLANYFWAVDDSHQASAIHLQAAKLTGIQTATNRATTDIGLGTELLTGQGILSQIGMG